MKKIFLMFVLAACYGSLAANPAPWWKWRGKIDNSIACAQTSPGGGWEKVNGPYRDARCEKLIVVK